MPGNRNSLLSGALHVQGNIEAEQAEARKREKEERRKLQEEERKQAEEAAAAAKVGIGRFCKFKIVSVTLS